MATPAERGIDKDVWLAVRTDAAPGTGTADDPFDASSRAKFDALMAGFGEDTVIHLYPGEYLTMGSDLNGIGTPARTGQWNVRPGWKVIGSGRGVTTIKLSMLNAEVTNGHAYAIFAGDPATEQTDDVEISDLTMDLDWASQPSATKAFFTMGVYLAGHDSSTLILRPRLTRLRITGAGSNSTTAEMFIVAINCVDGLLAEDVSVDGIAAGNATTGATVFAVGAEGNERCVVQNCSLDCRIAADETTWANGCKGFSMNGSHCRLECNYVLGATVGGVYHDTGYLEDAIVRDNHFEKVLAGFYFFLSSGATGRDVIFERNIVDLQGRVASWFSTPYGFLVGGTATGYSLDSAIVRGNIIRHRDAVASASLAAILITNVERVLLEHNLVDFPTGAPANLIFVGTAASLGHHNNRSMAGTLLTPYNYLTSAFWPDDTYVTNTTTPINTRVTQLEQNINTLRQFCVAKPVYTAQTTVTKQSPTLLHPDWIGPRPQ